jgi:ABC-type nitrate/sulfonate/bicarbonate transport system substrate-binding protein
MPSWLARVASGLAVALMLAGCGSPSASSPSQLTKLTVSLSSISFTQAVVPVAKEAGLFQKNGLDVDYVMSSNGIQAQLAGDVQVTMTSTEALILAYLGGANLEIVANMTHWLQQDFLVRPEIIKKLEVQGLYTT